MRRERPARRRSIATRWTVRYALLTLVAIALLGAGLYQRVAAAIREDAELLLEIQASEILAQMDQRPDIGEGDLARMIAPDIAAATPDLKLTVQVFDPERELVYARGMEEAESLPLAPEILAGEAGPVFREVDVGESYPFWVVAARGDRGEIVQVAIYSRTFIRSARRIRTAFLWWLPAAVVVATGVGYVVSRSSLRPVVDIVASARRVTSENLDERIPLSGANDEFDQIAEAVNGALHRVVRTVEGLRRLTADAAHQLRTPLTALRGRIEVTLETEDVPAGQRELLEELLAQVAHLSGVVDSLLDLARLEGGLDASQIREVDLGPLLDSIVEFLGPEAAESGVEVRRTGAASATVRGDPNWLAQLFLNLVENAIRYTRGPGKVAVDLAPGEGVVHVGVCDTGPGIAEEELERIFEPFHRVGSDPEIRGAGLGLTLAREFAEAHGGGIEVESAPGKGSTFRVRLPRSARAAPPHEPA